MTSLFLLFSMLAIPVQGSQREQCIMIHRNGSKRAMKVSEAQDKKRSFENGEESPHIYLWWLDRSRGGNARRKPQQQITHHRALNQFSMLFSILALDAHDAHTKQRSPAAVSTVSAGALSLSTHVVAVVTNVARARSSAAAEMILNHVTPSGAIRNANRTQMAISEVAMLRPASTMACFFAARRLR